MTSAEYILSISIDGTPDLPSVVLKALYRITGRSSVELRRSILAGEPVYVATLFGPEHLTVVPRFEKVAALLADLGIPSILHEGTEAERTRITPEAMREILEAE